MRPGRLRLPPLGDIAKDQHHAEELPLGVVNRRAAIIDGAFHAVPAQEQRLIGEAHHGAFPEDPRDGILDGLPGGLVDNPEHRRNVLAQGLGFGPPGEHGRHGVQKHHPALAVGGDDRIANTGQGGLEPLTAGMQRGGLHRGQPPGAGPERRGSGDVETVRVREALLHRRERRRCIIAQSWCLRTAPWAQRRHGDPPEEMAYSGPSCLSRDVSTG